MSNKQEATYGPIPDGPGAEVEELRAEVERWRVAHSEVCSVAQKRLNRAKAAEAELRSAVAEVEALRSRLRKVGSDEQIDRAVAALQKAGHEIPPRATIGRILDSVAAEQGEAWVDALAAERHSQGHQPYLVRELGYERRICSICRCDYPCPTVAEKRAQDLEHENPPAEVTP
jgi:hypothetical protein